jgi:hypothetical protein
VIERWSRVWRERRHGVCCCAKWEVAEYQMQYPRVLAHQVVGAAPVVGEFVKRGSGGCGYFGSGVASVLDVGGAIPR